MLFGRPNLELAKLACPLPAGEGNYKKYHWPL